MPKNATVDFIDLSVGIEKVLGDIPKACAEGVGKVVQKSVRKTAKKLRAGDYGKSGLHEWSEEYMKGFRSRADIGGMTPEGQVGNSAKPGLVHLLEKGHVTLTGRRTRSYPHMAPAFEEMEQEFVDEASKALGEALG